MKIVVKTLKGEMMDIDVELTTTVQIFILLRCWSSRRKLNCSKGLIFKVRRLFLKARPP
jgi:hypothetical protein